MESFIQPLNYLNKIMIDQVGMSRGLCLLWKDGLNLRVVDCQLNVINCELNIDAKTKVCLTCMYGALANGNRDAQWDYVHQFSHTIVTPWVLMGDLNIILCNSEKSGGIPYTQSTLDADVDFIDSLRLHAIVFSGNPFTWSNKRYNSEFIQEILDMVLGNAQWTKLYPNSHIYHLTPIASDHMALKITIM